MSEASGYHVGYRVVSLCGFDCSCWVVQHAVVVGPLWYADGHAGSHRIYMNCIDGVCNNTELGCFNQLKSSQLCICQHDSNCHVLTKELVNRQGATSLQRDPVTAVKMLL